RAQRGLSKAGTSMVRAPSVGAVDRACGRYRGHRHSGHSRAAVRRETMHRSAVLVALASALGAAGCAHHASLIATHTTHAAAQCAAQPIHITIVGDSLARGWGARDPKATLSARIFEFVNRHHPGTTMTNLGVPGATTDEI